jgi:hypothetical protein
MVMMSETLVRLLRDDFNLSSEQISWGLKQTQGMPTYLPMILWQYGLIDISQLDQLLDCWN